MKSLLLLAIRIYWRIPTKYHDKCIFRESCSHYVYRIAQQQGFRAGIRALLERNELCRPGYMVYKWEGRFYLKTAGGTLVREEEIAEKLLPPHSRRYLDFDDPLALRDRLHIPDNTPDRVGN